MASLENPTKCFIKQQNISTQTLPENRREGTLFNSFYEVSIILMSKTGLNIISVEQKKTEKSKYRSIPFV